MSEGRSCLRSGLTRPVFIWALGAQLTQIMVEQLPKLGFRKPGPILTLLPVLPLMGFLVALVRAIQRMDELQRRICLESVAIAFILTLALAFVFDGLQHAGIYSPVWDSLGTPMMAIWACAYVFSSWRYR